MKIEAIDYELVDADAHILEPGDIWREYTTEKFKDRVVSIEKDAEGKQFMQIDGAPARLFRNDILSVLGGMGRTAEEIEEASKKDYADGAPYGSMDPQERLKVMDEDKIAKSILYPSLGLMWETEMEDVELAQECAKSYNRWIADFCRDTSGRLAAVAHIILSEGNAAAQELERAVKDGCKGAFVAPFTLSRKPHAHTDFDAFWAKAEELGVPVGIHPMNESPEIRVYQRFRRMVPSEWFANVLGGQATQQAFLAMFQLGLFDRFPKLKLVVLESGGGWLPHLMERMDASFEAAFGATVPLKRPPSSYIETNCWISIDPDERSISRNLDVIGKDKIFWASDFPHGDHTADYIGELERLAADYLPVDARAPILSENVSQVYQL